MAFPVNPSQLHLRVHIGEHSRNEGCGQGAAGELAPAQSVPFTGPGQPVASPTSSAQPAAAEPQDQVQTSTPPPPSERVLPNQLKLQSVVQQGAVTGLYATLPGGPGHLLQLPVMLCISTTPAQNTVGGNFGQVKAYKMGEDGKVLRDAQNSPQELPAQVMSDGRIYVRTNPDNPSAPLAMLDADGSYGLATPPRLNQAGDEAGVQGYQRDQAEFVKADGTHGFRVNEQVAAFGQSQQSNAAMTAMTAMINPLALLGNGTPAGSRPVTYTEVNYTPQGPESRDVQFQQAPGQSWPQFDLGSQWKSRLTFSGGGMETRARTVHDNGTQISLEGGWNLNRVKKLFTEGSGMWGTNTFAYGSQQNITFTPLSRQQQPGTPAAQPSAPPPLPPQAPPPPPL